MALSAEIPELEQLEEDPFPDGEDDEVLHHMCREWFPVTAEQPDGGESTCTNCRLEFERKVEFEALVQRLADEDVRRGLRTIPGITITEDKKAV